MLNPFFSVILPSNRCDKYLEYAIDSIIKQDFKNFELLIVLSGDYINFINYLQVKFNDDRIRYLTTDITNLVFALNYAIDKSQCNYIVRMDADDISKTNRLSILWQTICRYPEVDVIGSSFDLIDSSGILIKRSSLHSMNNDEIRKKLVYRCCIAHPTVVFKKDTVLKIGAYCYGRFSEDYDLWLRMCRSKQVKFLIIDDPLLDYRFHPAQATGSDNTLNILAHDISLKLREFIITKKLKFLFGIIFSIFDYYYKKIIHK